MEYQVVDPADVIAAIPTKPTVLIVDDSLTMLKIAEAIVGARFPVIATTSPNEALALLQKNVVHILLTDLVMEEMSGLELISKVHQRYPDIGLILMTGFSTKQTAIGALKEGVQEYLEKPIEPKATLQAISHLWKLVKTKIENNLLVQALYKAHVINLTHEKHLDELNTKLQHLNREMQQELLMAGQVQRTYLPKLGCEKWVKSSGYYRPYGQVSGDCYHIDLIDNDTYQYVLGDGTGHGVAAGFITILIAMALIMKTHREQPHQTLARLNQMLTACTPADKFMTTVCMHIQKNGHCKVANAGHVETILIRKNQNAQLFKTEGMPLGLIDPPPVTYVSEEFDLQVGDRIFLCTDGITELQNRANEGYGMVRLVNFLQSLSNYSIDDIPHCMAQEIDEYTQGVKPRDDITLLALEFSGCE